MCEHILRIKERFKEVYNVKTEIIASAPGRIDLLNTHQDYKGLPVVGVGINLRCYVALSTRSDDYIHALSEDILGGESDRNECFLTIDKITSSAIKDGGFCNYVAAAYKVLYQEFNLSKGLNIYVKSYIPVGSGLGSSAALEVSLIKAITSLYSINLSTKDVAELAYRAEHDVMGIPCGRLDQYSSAYGGMLLINTKPPYNVEEIPFNEGIFVVLDSGIRHRTGYIHPLRQREIDRALDKLLSMRDLPSSLRVKLGRHYWEPKWELLSENEVEPYINRLNNILRRRILFTIKMHRSTLTAVSVMKGEISDISRALRILDSLKIPSLKSRINRDVNVKLSVLGLIMNYQHELLRDLYDVSLPKVEKIREAVLNAGALGCKLSGAGLGGSLVALVDSYDKAWLVLKEGLRAGAVNGWIVQKDQGVKREL